MQRPCVLNPQRQQRGRWPEGRCGRGRGGGDKGGEIEELCNSVNNKSREKTKLGGGVNLAWLKHTLPELREGNKQRRPPCDSSFSRKLSGSPTGRVNNNN